MAESKEFLESKNTNPPQQNHETSPFSNENSDAIDIYLLVKNLWGKKWVIIAVTTIVIFISVFYALKQPNIYKVEALIYPPSFKNIEALNLKRNLEPHQVGENFLLIRRNVFTAFKNNLNSRVLQKKFIQENDLLKYLDPNNKIKTGENEIFESFSNMVKIENIENKFGNKKGISISMLSSDPEFAARLINNYINFFDLEVVRSQVYYARIAIENQIKDIESIIESKRKMALIQRQDLILSYKEAVKTATKLEALGKNQGINFVQNDGKKQDLLEMQGKLTPLYYLGSKALEAEIFTLKNRRSDDPFIEGLRELQQKLFILRSLKIDEEELSSVNVDRYAYPSEKRIKPNRRKIVLLGALVGLFLGISLSIVIIFFRTKSNSF